MKTGEGPAVTPNWVSRISRCQELAWGELVLRNLSRSGHLLTRNCHQDSITTNSYLDCLVTEAKMKPDSKRRQRGMRSPGAQKSSHNPFSINNDLQTSLLNSPASAFAIPDEFISQLTSLITFQEVWISPSFSDASHLPLHEKSNKTHFHLFSTSISFSKDSPIISPQPSIAQADTH